MKDADHNGIKDSLDRSFDSYVEYAKKELARFDTTQRSSKLRIAHIAPRIILDARVDSIEKSSEFRTLVSDYLKFLDINFPPAAKESTKSPAPLDPDLLLFIRGQHSGLHDFFRRSEFYLQAFNGKKINSQEYFDLLVSRTLRRTFKITRLWVCNMRFPQPLIDFGSFQIRRYTKKQLDTVVSNDVNQVFYPGAAIDSKRLSEYWFVEEDISVVREGCVNRMKICEERSGTSLIDEPFEREFPPRVLQLLALGDFSDQYGGEFFAVPFEAYVDDDVLAAPDSVSALLREFPIRTDYDDDPVGTLWFKMSESQLKELRETIQFADKVLNLVDLEKYEWQFIRIALGYLAKAFLTKSGLDQLLWYVVVVESLFGEEGTGVLVTLKRRLAKVFGTTKAERKWVQKLVDDLYNFRSILVHGKSYSRKLQKTQLANARGLAKSSMSWFLQYIAEVYLNLEQNVSPEEFPRRDELLMVLDLDEGCSKRLGTLFSMGSTLGRAISPFGLNPDRTQK